MDESIKIALVGKKKSGRFFIAQHLKLKHHYKNWKLLDGVERILRTLYGYHSWERIPWEKQIEVYDFFYKRDPNVWIEFLKTRLEKTDKNIVINDARYINEVQELKKLGFVIIRVTAPEDRRKANIAKMLGPTADKGTVVLHEYYNTDPTVGYQVDYSIHNENPASTKEAIDIIVKNLTQPE